MSPAAPVSSAPTVAAPAARRRDGVVTARTITSLAGLDAIAGAWDALHRRADPVFTDTAPSWVRGWLGSTDGGDLRVVVAQTDDRLVGVLPLRATRRFGVTVARPVGAALDGAHGVLVDPAEPDAIDAMAGELDRALPRPWILVVNDVDPDDDALRRLVQRCARDGRAVRRMNRTVRCIVDLDRDPEVFRARVLSAKARYNLRRERRLLANDGTVRIERFSGASIDQDLLDRFEAIEGESWLARRGATVFDQPRVRRTVLATARAGLARAWILVVDDVDAAFVVGLGGPRAVSYKWTSFRERFRARSVGKLLTDQVIADAGADGAATLEFGLGDAEYKRFWCTRREPVERLAVAHGAWLAGAWAAGHRLARHPRLLTARTATTHFLRRVSRWLTSLRATTRSSSAAARRASSRRSPATPKVSRSRS